MTVRVEQIGDATLYLGDCRDVPFIADAIVTDPPYDIRANTRTASSGRRGSTHNRHGGVPTLRDWPEIVGDHEPFDPSPWLRRALTVVLFGANHFHDRIPTGGSWLVWDKREGGTSDDNADCEFAWISAPGPARLYSHLWRGMVRASETTDPRWHPTQKPVAVMDWVIERSRLDAGAVVGDPYMGSGTTGVAAVRRGHRFIGVEIHEPYFDIACRRIEEAQRQGDLLRDIAPKAKPQQTEIAL